MSLCEWGNSQISQWRTGLRTNFSEIVWPASSIFTSSAVSRSTAATGISMEWPPRPRRTGTGALPWTWTVASTGSA